MSYRKVLFIAYNFPPHGGAGVQRSLKFVKYLPNFDWAPIVVTTTPESSPVQDQSLLSDIPENTQILRIPGFSIQRLLYQAKGLRIQKLIVFLNLLLQIPDATVFWARNTRPILEEIINNDQPEVIYTSSGPYSCHLIGLWAKRQFNLPWFADFRDPWSENLLMPYIPGYRNLNRYLEKQVLKHANRVSCVSEPWLQDLKNNLVVNGDKFIVLPNGFDDADLPKSASQINTDRFTLTHIGSFNRNRKPDSFIEAIQRIIKSGHINSQELHVVFIGRHSTSLVPDQAPYERINYIPHKELNNYRIKTNVFVLILDTSPQNIGNHSGKIYEYIASNRPILGIVPRNGVAEDLINRTKTGNTVGDNSEEIAKAILAYYVAWKSKKLECHPNWDVINQYTRRNQTSILASEFEKLAKSKSELQ